MKTWVAGKVGDTSAPAKSAFDRAVHEYVGFYGDPLSSLNAALAEDPQMAMGNLFLAGMMMFSTGVPVRSEAVTGPLAVAKKALEGATKGSREAKHLQALEVYSSNNNMKAATLIWEEIIKEHPEDELAAKFAHDAYFFLGQSKDIHDSVERFLPVWKKTKDRGMYGYGLGMLAFGLEETGRYPEAEKAAMEALEINYKDAWALHAMAHVLEMKGAQKEGRKFLESRMNGWTDNNFLKCHIWWHWCLYDIELGDFDSALAKYDKYLSQAALTSGAMLDLVDVSALLQRLQFQGVDVSDRWKRIHDVWAVHAEDNCLSFNDAHLAMVALGAGREDTYRHLHSSITNYTNTHGNATTDHYNEVSRRVGLRLCEAFEHHTQRHHAEVVASLLDVQKDLHMIGGSHAQRDLVAQLLLQSLVPLALKEKTTAGSNTTHYGTLAAKLLRERKAAKPSSGITDRLIAKLA